MKLLYIILTCVIVLSAKPRVVAYSYATDPTTTDIDFNKTTHLIASFVKSDSLGNLNFDSWVPENNIISLLRRVDSMGVVPMIALGTTASGWAMTKNQSTRANFIKNIIAWCDSVGAKGIDLDLEGTAEEFNWGSPGTFFPEPYESLAVELRAALPDSILLTAAVGSLAHNGAQWSDKFIEQLDWINVMIYDRALTWDSSPVENHAPWNAFPLSTKYWHGNRGLEKDKILLGVPFYARGWDLDNNVIYKEDAGWKDYYPEDWAYNEFIDKFNLSIELDSFFLEPGETINHSRKTGIDGKAVIYFNGKQMIARKTAWMVDSGYGGIMIWHIAADTKTANNKSLLATIDSVINNSTPIHKTVKPTLKDRSITANILNNKIILTSLLPNKNYLLKLYTTNGKILNQLNIRPNNTGTAKVSFSKNNANSIIFIELKELSKNKNPIFIKLVNR